MAGKRKDDPRTQREDTVKVDWPEGARVMKTTAGGFYTFARKGEQLIGTLVGTETIKRKNPKQGEPAEEDRYVFLPKGSSETVWLPNHHSLVTQLAALVGEGFILPIPNVRIVMKGTRPAPTVRSGYVVVYEVGVLPAGEQQQLA